MRILNGTVKEAASGLPLPQANVVALDKNRTPLQSGGGVVGTATDHNGNFKLEVPDTAVFLAVSYIGFQKTAIPINQDEEYIFDLEEDTQSINEVEIVANRPTPKKAFDWKKAAVIGGGIVALLMVLYMVYLAMKKPKRMPA